MIKSNVNDQENTSSFDEFCTDDGTSVDQKTDKGGIRTLRNIFIIDSDSKNEQNNDTPTPSVLESASDPPKSFRQVLRNTFFRDSDSTGDESSSIDGEIKLQIDGSPVDKEKEGVIQRFFKTKNDMEMNDAESISVVDPTNIAMSSFRKMFQKPIATKTAHNETGTTIGQIELHRLENGSEVDKPTTKTGILEKILRVSGEPQDQDSTMASNFLETAV